MSVKTVKQALVLFAHGARNPEWATPFRRVQQLVQARLPDVAVELAFLEFMQPDLPAVVRALVQCGCREIAIKPLFFASSGHVLRDVPGMIVRLQAEFPALRLHVAPAIGEDELVLAAIAETCAAAL